jgi:hypothetical protein
MLRPNERRQLNGLEGIRTLSHLGNAIDGGQALAAIAPPVSPRLESQPRAVDLAVILPTYNERANVAELISRLDAALAGLCWEAIFVDDDSPDGTGELVHSYAQQDARIRLIERVGRRGLSSACIEGMMATSARFIAVMDADLQHDETVLPAMLARLRQESLDMVVGTRNAGGGSMGQFCASRVLLSRLGQKISQAVCSLRLSDPMSGFFMVRRSRLMAFGKLNPTLVVDGSQRRAYGAIQLEEHEPGDTSQQHRFPAAVMEAIQANYRPMLTESEAAVWVPRR